jgi:iron complex transport system ATP-binding protein
VNAVSATDVTVIVEGHCLVDEVSLEAAPGTWHTVIGPNGAGKTTLIEAIAGVRKVARGQVRVVGRDVHTLSERARASVVAFVPQHPVAPAGMTVMDYVGLGRTAHQGAWRALSAASRSVVDNLVDRLGLGPLASRDISTLSGGERQRAVIARAVAQSAPVVVVDEPTTGLDVRHQLETLALLRGEVVERGLTVVATLHDLTLAGQFADYVVLLDGGRVAAAGPPGEVVRDAALVRAYGIGLRVIEVDGHDVVVPSSLSSALTPHGESGLIG